MGDASNTTTPSIYVACLSAYNNGYLHGAWIDASQEPDTINAEIVAMLKRSPMPDAEEYAIHDYEGFGNMRLSEYEGIAEVCRKAAFIIEHGDLGAAILEHFSGDMDEAEDALNERYYGQYISLADYMQELTEQCQTIPENLRYYIDWDSMARDAELSGDLFTIETAHNEVHVFSGH